MNWKKWGPVAAVGAAAAAVVTFVAVKSKAASNDAAATLTGANPFMLLPDDPATPTRTIGPLAKGTTVTLNLPAGAAWVSLTTPGGASIPVSGSTGAGLTINRDGAVVAVYTDKTGQHTSTINFTTA